MDVRVGPKRRLSVKELMLLNCGAGEDLSLLDSREMKPVKSILKEISPEYSLERLMLKLKLSLILWLPHAKN